MFWNPDRILSSIYELRNRGLISKVSEIDSVCQFTTRYDLADLVNVLKEPQVRK
jgi:DNA repair protein RadC